MIYRSPDEIRDDLRERVRQRRLDENWTQTDVARKAGLSRRAVQEFEATGRATVDSLIRILHVLSIDCAAVVPPRATIDPIAVFEATAPRQRASRSSLPPLPVPSDNAKHRSHSR